MYIYISILDVSSRCCKPPDLLKPPSQQVVPASGTPWFQTTFLKGGKLHARRKKKQESRPNGKIVHQAVANEGLVRDSLLKMVHNPGGDCYWEGGTTQIICHQPGFP